MKYDIPTLTSEAVGLLKSLISIPSVSRDEERAADCLQQYIELQGMETGRSGNNVWCLSPGFDLGKPTLLLNSHIDTVKPVQGWRHDPFKPVLETNGKLYGLGSNDAGASVVSLLQVFLTLCRTNQRYNLIYLASNLFRHCGRTYRNAAGHCGEGIDVVGCHGYGTFGTCGA